MNRNKRKLSRKQKISGALVGCMILATCVGAVSCHALNQNQKVASHNAMMQDGITIGNELKLNAYNAITDSDATIFLDHNTDKAVAWGMDVIDDTMGLNGIKLKEKELAAIREKQKDLMKKTLNCDEIKSDGNGLTEVAKGYIANTVAKSLLTIKPSLDKKERIDAGAVTYEKVLDIDAALRKMQKTNRSLVKNIKNLNETRQLFQEDGRTVNTMLQSKTRDRLAARTTAVRANTYVLRNSNNVTTNSNVSRTNKKNNTYISRGSGNNAGRDVLVPGKQEHVTNKIVQNYYPTKVVKQTIQKDIHESKNYTVYRDNNETLEKLEKVFSYVVDLQKDQKEVVRDISDVTTNMKNVTSDVLSMQDAESRRDSAVQSLQDKADTNTGSISANKREIEKNRERLEQNTEVLRELENNLNNTSDEVLKIKSDIEKEIVNAQRECDTRINDTRRDFEKALNETNVELNNTIDENDRKINEKVDRIKRETDHTIAKNKEEAAKELQVTKEIIVNQINETSSAIHDRITKCDEKQSQVNKSLEDLISNTKAALENADNTLQNTLVNFAKSVNSHTKTEVIANQTISPTIGSPAIIQNEKLIGANDIRINYMKNYQDIYGVNISYSCDKENGILTISVDKTPKESMVISDIVIMRSSTDELKISK